MQYKKTNSGIVKLSRIWSLGAITNFISFISSSFDSTISNHMQSFVVGIFFRLFFYLQKLYDHLLHHKNIYCTTYTIAKNSVLWQYFWYYFSVAYFFFFKITHAWLFHVRTYGYVLTEVFSPTLSHPFHMCSTQFFAKMQTFFFEIEILLC